MTNYPLQSHALSHALSQVLSHAESHELLQQFSHPGEQKHVLTH